MVEVRERPDIRIPDIMEKIREIERGFELARVPERLSNLESRVGLNVEIVTDLENKFNLLASIPVDVQNLKDITITLDGKIENVKSLLSQYVNVSDFRPTLEALIPDTTFDSGLVNYTDYFTGTKVGERRLVDILHTLSTVLGGTLNTVNKNYMKIKEVRGDMAKWYALKTHHHPDLYSTLGHLHDDLYAKAVHLHDQYSLADHVHAFEDIISDLPEQIVSYGATGNFNNLFDGRLGEVFGTNFGDLFPESFTTALNGAFPTHFDARFLSKMTEEFPGYFESLLGSTLLDPMGGFPSGKTVEQYLMNLYERMAEKMDVANLSSTYFDDGLILLKKMTPGGLTQITASLKAILDQHNLSLGVYKDIFTGQVAGLRDVAEGLKDEMAKFSEVFSDMMVAFQKIRIDFSNLRHVFGDLGHAYSERFITNAGDGFGIMKGIFKDLYEGGSTQIQVRDVLGNVVWKGGTRSFYGLKSVFNTIKDKFDVIRVSSWNLQEKANSLYSKGVSYLDW